MQVRGKFGVWQQKQHRHWRGSSVWHHIRLAPGITVNVWKMKGLVNYVIEFGSVSERGPSREHAAKRAALKLARALCIEAAERAQSLLAGVEIARRRAAR
jgi:RNA 3'-terminal phosphate cyclase